MTQRAGRTGDDRQSAAARRSRTVAAITLVALLPAGVAAAATAPCPASRWVAGWQSAPSDGLGGISGAVGFEAVPGNGRLSPLMLTGGTFRLTSTPSLSGTTVRVRLSNRFGTQPVTFLTATVGTQATGAAVVPGTLRELRFSGSRSVTAAPGQDVVSDPVRFDVRALGPVSVSAFVAGPISALTEHATARQRSYFAPAVAGDQSGNTAPDPFGVQTTSRPFLSGLDILAPGAAGTVVTLGDSITDGFGGLPVSGENPVGAAENPAGVDENRRWPDELARRLRATNRPLAVVNAGITGNRILRDGADGTLPIYAAFGPSALARLRADVTDRAGVTDVIVLEGINDLKQTPNASVEAVIKGLTELVQRLHAVGLRTQIGTLTPLAGDSQGTPDVLSARRTVNAWIRGQRIADGVIDFDAAVRDPGQPERLLPAYDSGDHIHPSPAGYHAMAGAVPLDALHGQVCGATASPAARSRLRLTVTPSRVTVGAATTVRVRVRAISDGRLGPLAGARVRLAGRRSVTGAGGRVTFRITRRHTGALRVRAAAPGRLSASRRVRVVSAPRGGRP